MAVCKIAKYGKMKTNKGQEAGKEEEEQGRIHGHQLRMGGQGRKCAFSHFSTRWLRTDQQTDGQSLL